MAGWIVLAAVLVAVAVVAGRSAGALAGEEAELRADLAGVDALAARAGALRATLEELRDASSRRRRRLADLAPHAGDGDRDAGPAAAHGAGEHGAPEPSGPEGIAGPR